MSDLDDVLNGVEPEPVIEPIEEVEEITETLETKGEESTPPVEETPVEVTTQDLQAKIESLEKESNGLKSAAAAERRKRQDMQKDEPKEDFWTDPDKSLNAMETRLSDRYDDKFINLSEDFARKTYDDYDAKMEVFGKLTQNDPSLVAKMRANSNPAEFAYNEADKHQKLAEFGDLDSYADKIRAEERVKFNSLLEERVSEEITKRKLPGSLANTRAAGGNTTVNVNDSLESILGR